MRFGVLKLGVPTPVALGFAAGGRQSRGLRIRECRPLVRQNKVGGGQAPDQPETPDRSPERGNRRAAQKSHHRIFLNCYLSHKLGRASEAVRSQAEPGNEILYLWR